MLFGQEDGEYAEAAQVVTPTPHGSGRNGSVVAEKPRRSDGQVAPLGSITELKAWLDQRPLLMDHRKHAIRLLRNGPPRQNIADSVATRVHWQVVEWLSDRGATGLRHSCRGECVLEVGCAELRVQRLHG